MPIHPVPATPGNALLVPSDLQQAVEHLSEGGLLPVSDVAAMVERALVSTYRRLVEDDPAIHAEVDLSTGIFRLFLGVEGAERLELVMPSGDFLRQAARAVRAGVTDALRSADQARVVREVAVRRGDLVDGIVERRGGAAWWLRLGDILAVLPPEQQMPGEELVLHQHLKVVIMDSRRRTRDAVAVVSRAHPELLRLLLEQEVPELQSGQVVIRAIVREAGRRSKVAVSSTAPGIDARGACIGARGVRHRAVTSELGEEQVQIVTWSDDEATLVANALAPATALAVELDATGHTAHVTVAPDQLSLAIGRSGENARLVARLTGWRIDIRPADGT